MNTIQKSRFDTKLPKEQKELFEYAANLGGFKTLSEFVLFSAQQYAASIIEKREAILSSEKDRAIFFDTLTKSPKPNATLQKAALRYKSLLKK